MQVRPDPTVTIARTHEQHGQGCYEVLASTVGVREVGSAEAEDSLVPVTHHIMLGIAGPAQERCKCLVVQRETAAHGLGPEAKHAGDITGLVPRLHGPWAGRERAGGGRWLAED